MSFFSLSNQKKIYGQVGWTILKLSYSLCGWVVSMIFSVNPSPLALGLNWVLNWVGVEPIGDFETKGLGPRLDNVPPLILFGFCVSVLCS